MKKWRIDFHTHSNPTLIPVHLGLGPFWGITHDALEDTLRAKDAASPGVSHGAAYGPHNLQLINDKFDTSFLWERTLPMIENHPLQTVCIGTWGRNKFLDKVEDKRNQMDLIQFVADNGGLSVIDIPHKVESTNGSYNADKIFVNFRGQATVKQLAALPDAVKARTFLCWNAMLPYFMRSGIDDMAKATGLRLVGGSDAIMAKNSLLSAYSEALASKLSDVVDRPELIGETHRGNTPYVFGERWLRYVTAFVEKTIHTNTSREKLADSLIKKRLYGS